MVRRGAPSAAARPARRRLHADPSAPRVRRARLRRARRALRRAARPRALRAGARRTRCTSGAARSLEHRGAQHRRFAIEIVRGMGAGRGRRRADRRGGRAGLGRSRQLRALPRRPAAARRRCAAPRCTVGLVSNTDRELEPFAAELGIARRLRARLAAHGRRKPCATIFAAALALGGAPPEAAVMVGDNIDDDIAGALALRPARRARRSQRPPSRLRRRARARPRRAAGAARARGGAAARVRPAGRRRLRRAAPRAAPADRCARWPGSSARSAARSRRAASSARGRSARRR